MGFINPGSTLPLMEKSSQHVWQKNLTTLTFWKRSVRWAKYILQHHWFLHSCEVLLVWMETRSLGGLTMGRCCVDDDVWYFLLVTITYPLTVWHFWVDDLPTFSRWDMWSFPAEYFELLWSWLLRVFFVWNWRVATWWDTDTSIHGWLVPSGGIIKRRGLKKMLVWPKIWFLLHFCKINF